MNKYQQKYKQTRFICAYLSRNLEILMKITLTNIEYKYLILKSFMNFELEVIKNCGKKKNLKQKMIIKSALGLMMIQFQKLEKQMKNQNQNQKIMGLKYQDEEVNEIEGESIYLTQTKLNGLVKSMEQMSVFIKTVLQKKIEPSNNVVYKYSGKYENLSISAKEVHHLLDKRIERMMKNKRIKRNWSEEDTQILAWALIHYAELHQIPSIQNMTHQHWKNISNLIPGTSANSCMFKLLSLKKVKLSEQQWTENQSNILASVVNHYENHNIDWRVISQQLFNLNNDSRKIYRNAKQCKEHWTCYLDPKLKKGPWSPEQDLFLLQHILENNGKKKWADMSKILKGRTENALKNRYCLILEKQKNKHHSKNELQQISSVISVLKKTKNKQKKVRIEKSQSPQTIVSLEMCKNKLTEPENQKMEANINKQIKFENRNLLQSQIYDQNYSHANSSSIFPALICPGNQLLIYFNQFNQFV